jgi:hypothetical protein
LIQDGLLSGLVQQQEAIDLLPLSHRVERERVFQRQI